jgi:hypothetical protein
LGVIEPKSGQRRAEDLGAAISRRGHLAEKEIKCGKNASHRGKIVCRQWVGDPLYIDGDRGLFLRDITKEEMRKRKC